MHHGVFFPIGKHATYHPEILRQVLAAGHTVGTHTWSHPNLNGKKMTDEMAKDELEKGFSAREVRARDQPVAVLPLPAIAAPPSAVAYLGSRNVAMFSCDVDSFDFKSKDADQVINTVMTGLEKKGKGIILMHDFQKHTAEALPTLLRRLKAGGYKIVAAPTTASRAVCPAPRRRDRRRLAGARPTAGSTADLRSRGAGDRTAGARPGPAPPARARAGSSRRRAADRAGHAHRPEGAARLRPAGGSAVWGSRPTDVDWSRRSGGDAGPRARRVAGLRDDRPARRRWTS